MKNLFSKIHNKLTSFPNTTSLLFFSLFGIHLSIFRASQSWNNLPAILSNPLLKILEIITEILQGLLEGSGSWTGTMLPSEASPSSSPSVPESTPNLEPNPDLEKGQNKLTKIIVLFIIIMLIPILSDPSINISILPFFIINKDSIHSHSKNISSLFIKYFIFIYYVSILTVIMALDSTITVYEAETMDILISVGLLATLKGKLKALNTASPKPGSRSATPESWQNVALDEVLDKEFDRQEGRYPDLSSLPNQRVRTSPVTDIDYSGSVVDIRAGSEWDIQTQTTVSSNGSYNYCSTCPQVYAASLFDPADVSPITNSMIESIANEETSSINLENPSTISSSVGSRTYSTFSSPGIFETRRVINATGDLVETSSTSLPYTDPQASMSSNLESQTRTNFSRIRALHELDNPHAVPITDAELSRFYIGLPREYQRWVDQVGQADESFIPFLLLSTNIISNKINMETLRNIIIYLFTSILFLSFLLLSVNITDLIDSPESAVTSVSMFTVLKHKLLNITKSKPTAEVKSEEVIVNSSPNISLESLNEDWHSCKTHLSIGSSTQLEDWHTCRESISSDSPSDNCSISRSSPRERLHFSWNNSEQKTENGSEFIDPTTGDITEDHPLLIEFHRALTYKKLFYSNNPISEDLIDESFLPFFLLFSNSLLSNKIKNSKLFMRITNSKTFGYLKTSLLFKIFVTSVLSLIIKYLILKLWSISIDPITNIFIPLLAFYDPVLLQAWSTRYFKIMFECFIPNSIHLDSVGGSDPHQDGNVVKNNLRKFRKWIKKCIKSIKHRFDTDGDSYHTANSSLDNLILDQDYHSANSSLEDLIIDGDYHEVLDWDLTNPQQSLRFEMNRRSLPPVPDGYCDHADLVKYQEHLPAFHLTSNEDAISTRARADSGIFPDGNPFTSRDREWNRLQNNNLRSRFSHTTSVVSSKITHMEFDHTSISASDTITNNSSDNIPNIESNKKPKNSLKGIVHKALKIIKK